MRLVAQLVELKPNKAQIEVFHRHSEARRIARNDLIAEYKKRKERDDKVVLKQLRPWFNAIKDGKHAWMRRCSQNAVKGGLIDAVDALSRFFKKQNKFPRFEQKGKHCRFRIDNGVDTVKVEQRESRRLPFLKLPRIGLVRMKEALRWPKAQVRECHIKQKGGRWFASVLMSVPDEERRCGEGTCGIDLGLSTFATIYYGNGEVEKVHAPRPLRRMLHRLRCLSKSLARKSKGSHNWYKAKRRIARLHYRIGCIRQDFLQKLTHRLAALAKVVKVETLNIAGWMKMWGRVVGDLAPHEFIRQLSYKLEWRGGKLEKAHCNYPSSKLCSSCGRRNKTLTLAERRWVCVCGVEHDRDINAARNLHDYMPTARGARKRHSACVTKSHRGESKHSYMPTARGARKRHSACVTKIAQGGKQA